MEHLIASLSLCIEMTNCCHFARICPNSAKNVVYLVHFWCNHLQLSWNGGWKMKNQRKCLLLLYLTPFLILLILVRLLCRIWKEVKTLVLSIDLTTTWSTCPGPYPWCTLQIMLPPWFTAQKVPYNTLKLMKG